MSISRRNFLETAAITGLAAAAVPANEAMPTRVLGKTGAKVSMLAFGCGSRFLSYKEEDKAIEALKRALDGGVTYVDTAYSYGNGVSEERVGKALVGRRKGLFLATKMQDRTADGAMKVFEAGLKRLQTDQVDLLHIHGLIDAADLAAIEAPNGVLKTLLKARDQKMTRFIGITCHMDPHVLKTALERHDFDCTQMALNGARAGMRTPDNKFALGLTETDSFESVALPVAVRKKMGVIAMKVFGQGALSKDATAEKLFGYSLSLPVTCAVAGMPQLENIDANIATVKNFRQLSRKQMDEVASKLTRHKVAMDRFFHHHVDA